MPLDKLKDFEKVKLEAATFYRNVGSVRCPYLGRDVSFNRQGLEHLLFKKRKHARPRADQHMRLKLLHLAPRVLSQSHTVQGVLSQRAFVRQRSGKTRERVLKNVTYYEFVAVLQTIRIRVVVRRVEGGQHHFWSIIPYWRQSSQRNKRLLHDGDPEND